MKPISRKVRKSSSYLQVLPTDISVGAIKGYIKADSKDYINCRVVLFTKNNLLPLAVRHTDSSGYYEFLSLSSNLNTYLIAFDNLNSYNAVIKDNVFPK